MSSLTKLHILNFLETTDNGFSLERDWGSDWAHRILPLWAFTCHKMLAQTVEEVGSLCCDARVWDIRRLLCAPVLFDIVGRRSPNLFFNIFFIPNPFNSLPQGIEHLAECYSNALTNRLGALSLCAPVLALFTFLTLCSMLVLYEIDVWLVCCGVLSSVLS